MNYRDISSKYLLDLKISNLYKLNLRFILKQLGYLLVFLHPIDSYILKLNFIFNLSFYRVVYLILLGLFVVELIHKLKLKPFITLYTIILFYMLGMIWSILLSNHLGEFSAYFLNEIMGLVLIVIFVNIYEINDIERLIKYFIASAIFPLMVSLYVYYEFIFNLKLVDTLPLSDAIPIFRTFTFDTKKFRASFFPRLGLPYGISPALAISMSILIIIQYFRIKSGKHRDKKNVFIIFILVLLMIGTLTRTTVISLIITFIIYKLVSLNKMHISFKVKGKHIIITCLLLLGFIFLPKFVLFDKLLYRMTSQNFTEDRHFLLLLEGYHILTRGIKNFLIGIGDGNLVEFTGKYTFLPPHSLLNSYLTILVHRGMLGFLLIISLYIYLFYTLLYKSIQKTPYSVPFFYVLVNILIALNFYELRFAISIWIFMAIAFILINKSKKCSYQ